jgi:hypothetical protein
MAQSSRDTIKGQRKGKNVNVGLANLPPSPFIVVTTAASGASIAAKNLTTTRKQIPTVQICNN